MSSPDSQPPSILSTSNNFSNNNGNTNHTNNGFINDNSLGVEEKPRPVKELAFTNQGFVDNDDSDKEVLC